MKCVDHLEFTDAICPDCGLHVDRYGNTEAQFDHCCSPDCGCDGGRLCMAPSGASERAVKYNVEGMYQAKSARARLAALGDIISENATKEAK